MNHTIYQKVRDCWVPIGHQHFHNQEERDQMLSDLSKVGGAEFKVEPHETGSTPILVTPKPPIAVPEVLVVEKVIPPEPKKSWLDKLKKLIFPKSQKS